MKTGEVQKNPWMKVNQALLVKAIIYSSDQTRREIAENLQALI